MPNTNTSISIPRTASELIKQRKTQARLSNTDRMEQYVLSAWDDPDLTLFISAMEDGERFVEGSPRADDQEMARIIREMARMNKDEVVGNWTLDVCRRTLGSVLRRFAVSRVQGKKAAQ